MAFNFIGPIVMFVGVTSLFGMLFGLIKKDRKVTKISFILFAMVVSIFLLDWFIFE